MNIDKVYVCSVYKCEFSESEYDNYDANDIERNMLNFIILDENLSSLKTLKKNIIFVKRALVYYSKKHACFIDLETNEKYHIGMSYSTDNGLFVDVRKQKIYGRELMDSKRKHFTKKKILKKYNEFRDDNNECK